MRTRVITAVVALALFLPALVLGGLPLSILVTVMAGISVYELFHMHKLDIKSFEGVLAIIASAMLVFPLPAYFKFLPKDKGQFLLFFLIVMLFLGASVISKNTYSIDEAAFPVIASLYVGVGFSSLLNARKMGLPVLFLALFIVWATDIGAYFVGLKYGRHKLCPEVSPSKTIEGALGGLLSAFIVTMIFVFLFEAKNYFHHTALTVIFLSLLFSAVAQFGDLVESSIKRHFDVKDSGKLLPGHGGVLDRFDSLLFILPLMQLFKLF
ncbi:MAG: phosphatidate cytidylyltransferase [Streptococcaceae bacterium]|jgi:phosphatidate cytidylyltransferase|nr:phosphatidate cytidylyltransferase [Streptococcaceae bacterium]